MILFRNDPRGRDILANGVYITFGSQINNPFARSRLFPGQIQVPNVRFGTIWLIPRIRSSQHLSRSATGKFLQVPTTSPFWSFADGDQCGPRLFRSPKHEKCCLDCFGASPRAPVRSPDRLTIFSRQLKNQNGAHYSLGSMIIPIRRTSLMAALMTHS